MSKLTKLLKEPRSFVRDAPLYRRLFNGAPQRGAKAQGASRKATPKTSHPLPTLNLAEEMKIPDEERRRAASTNQFLRYTCSPEATERVVERLAGRIAAVFADLGLPERRYEDDVRDFLRTCEENPALGAARTTAVGSLLWLFMLSRAIEPSVIVESGVFKGASLFTFARSRPEAKLYAYDIDLSNLTYRSPQIHLHEGDWAETFPRPEGPNDLCYFDDHINNCLRVRQAYDLGFRHVVFDDSPDIGELHRWRFPGVPTIQMVANETLREGEYVEWIWKDRKLRYTYREEDTHGAASLVEKVVELPSVSALTGRTTGIQTYVRLRAKG